MKKVLRQRMAKIALMTNGFSFIMAGVTYFEDSKVFAGAIQCLIGASNILLLFFMRENTRDRLNCLVLILNMVAALFVSFDYYMSGKTYLQYAWLLVVALNVFALWMQARKRKHLPGKT